MPIRVFNGQTFVAFTDISGFKALMRVGRGEKAINDFYGAGYRVLQDSNDVNGFFVSDSGVLFSTERSEGKSLDAILLTLKRLNQQALRHKLMLTTSIAWGHFSYHTRMEFEGIVKQPIYGNAYVDAFLDNEGGKPKMKPGQIRIVKKTLKNAGLPDTQCLPFMEETIDHFNYFWSVNSPDQIPEFKRRYSDGYNRQYLGMMSALRGREFVD